MAAKNPKVDAFLQRAKKWPRELKKLRAILLASELTEELKWYQPCYTYNGANVIILGEFKDNCVISFFKGALLKDPQSHLTLPGENTQSARVIRFTSVRQITELEPIIHDLIRQTIANEEAGLQVQFKKSSEFAVPAEFQTQLDANRALKKAFDALTPGRQRAYLMHFSSAKQSATRAARVEKHLPRILKGLGLND